MQWPENLYNSGFIQIKESLINKLGKNTLQSFTMSQIVTSFVEAIVADKQPVKPKDYKSLKESCSRFLKEGLYKKNSKYSSKTHVYVLVSRLQAHVMS